jgi:hypothetical protein
MKDRLKFKAVGTIHNTDTVGTTREGALDLSTSALTLLQPHTKMILSDIRPSI